MLHARVPTAKLLFYPGLLHAGTLAGESEVIAIGGDYDVELGLHSDVVVVVKVTVIAE